MQLYTFPLSSNGRRAVMTALHLEPLLSAPVQLHQVDLMQGAQRAPEFLKINPSGKVPALVDGDFTLSESCAIMQYLAEKAPGQTIWPTDMRARAQVSQWMYWCASEMTPLAGLLTWENWLKALLGQGSPNPTLVAQSTAMLHAHFVMFDNHLAGREWIVGEQLSLADFAISATLMHAKKAQLPINDLQHLAAWMERVRKLPEWQKTELQ
jgi:glutathione S-transferase